jgi:aconitate hydratase 2/2-methylisocitrate dehydratase
MELWIMIEAYFQHEAERREKGIPPLPLDPEQTKSLCELLQNPPSGKEEILLFLLKERVSPGVDPAALVKAEFLASIMAGNLKSPLVTPLEAVRILGTMLGGYNVQPLIAALAIPALAEEAVAALSRTILVYDAFDEIAALARTLPAARNVLLSWANAEWFTERPTLPETVTVRIFKVDGEINTDDFSCQ